jgi:hypothetical protein
MLISAVEDDVTARQVRHEPFEDFVTNAAVGQREDE